MYKEKHQADIKEFISLLIEMLASLKEFIGSFESNHEYVREFVLKEFEVCKLKFEKDKLDKDLETAFVKVSMLIEVLLLFKINELERTKLIDKSRLIS